MRPCADGGGRCRRGKRSDSQQGTAREPSSAGAAKTTGATRLGAAGVGQKAQGGTRKTKTVSRARPAEPEAADGGGGHRAPISPRSAAPSGARMPLGTLVPGPPRSPAAPRPLPLQVPFEEREGPHTSARGGQAALFPNLSSRLCPPQPPLTGMQAATIWAAAATRLRTALTSTLAGPHQLSYQHKQESRGRGTTPTAPSRPSGSDAHAGRAYPPGPGEALCPAPARASRSSAAPFPRHAQ